MEEVDDELQYYIYKINTEYPQDILNEVNGNISRATPSVKKREIKHWTTAIDWIMHSNNSSAASKSRARMLKGELQKLIASTQATSHSRSRSPAPVRRPATAHNSRRCPSGSPTCTTRGNNPAGGKRKTKKRRAY